MRFFTLPAVACIAVMPLIGSGPALADSCRDEIAAMYHGGALDPFVRENRRETTISVHPDGSTTPVSDVFWDGVMRSVSKSGTVFFLTYDGQMWMGPTMEGPWTNTGSPLPDDFEQMTRLAADQNAANISEANCPGTVDVAGQTLTAYVYRTRTDTNSHGSWFGGLHTALLDPKTGRLVRLDMAEMVSSWAPDPTAHTNVMTVVYDPTIQVKNPEQ